MTYKEIFQKVSEELDLPKDLVVKTYKSYWTYIKDTIQSLPLKEDLDENSFNNIKTSFNIPSLGKLHCTYNRYINTKKRFNYIKLYRENAKNKKDKTNV